jgi:RNA polymerase sigma-70 factor (ECF subfamily)
MTERVERATVADDQRASFATRVAAELDGAYRLAGVILGDRWQAEDATHDAIVQAWLRYGSLRDPGRFPAWFGRILVNVCRDRIRERGRRPIAVGGPVERPVDDRTGAVDDRLLLDRAFAELSRGHRIALVLRCYADLPIDAIAELVGVRRQSLGLLRDRRRGQRPARRVHAGSLRRVTTAGPPSRARTLPRPRPTRHDDGWNLEGA